MLLRLRSAPAVAAAARIQPAVAAVAVMPARGFSGRPPKGGRAAAAAAEGAAADPAAAADASAAAAAAGSSSSSVRRAYIAPPTPHRSVLRASRALRASPANSASFQARVGAALIKEGKTAAEVAEAATAAAKTAEDAVKAAKPAAVPASPLASVSAAEELSSGQTALELIPGESAFSGQSPAAVAPLLASLFRTKSSAQYSPSKRRNMAISPQKLNDLCRMVRGVSVGEALIQLKLSQKRKAGLLAATIARAARHGVNTHNMERSRLYISELWVGQGQHLKRLDIKARGRAGTKRRYRSNLFVRVREQGSDAEHYKGVWKHGGHSHNRLGQEVRIGRAGRTISTIQSTLAAMSEWRTARGMSARPIWKTRDSDAAKAFRAQGTATDLEAVFGKQKNLPVKMMDRVEKPFE